MVPAPRLHIKDAQGEDRDVLQGLLSLQDAEVALPLDSSGASCRLSRYPHPCLCTPSAGEEMSPSNH